jgi:hypothetical protein
MYWAVRNCIAMYPRPYSQRENIFFPVQATPCFQLQLAEGSSWHHHAKKQWSMTKTFSLARVSVKESISHLWQCRCRSLSLNIFFSVQARFLISIAICRGVLLEPACKKSMTFDKNFQFGKIFSERIHIAFVPVLPNTQKDISDNDQHRISR